MKTDFDCWVSEILLFYGRPNILTPKEAWRLRKLSGGNTIVKAVNISSAKAHRTLSIAPDGSFELDNLDGLKPEEIDGF